MVKGKFIFALAVLLIISGIAMAQAWNYTVKVRPTTTAFHNLSLAVTAGASNGYDAFLDVPYFTPPDGRGAYFPLNDPVHPAYTKLSTDVRGIYSGYYYWVIRLEGYYGLDPRVIEWNLATLPVASGLFHIGTKAIIHPVDSVATWIDMSTVDNITFGPVMDVVIRYMPSAMLDTRPPYITGFIPANGSAGVLLNRPIQFDVKDDLSGVNMASVVMRLWYGTGAPTDVTSLITWTPIIGGYRATLNPPTGTWPELTIVNYSVRACDLASPANCMGVDSTISFSTAPSYPDVNPPYFESLIPAPGDTSAGIGACIQLSIKDSDSGVDSSTIALVFGGVPIARSAYSVTELGTGSYWYTLRYCPPSPLSYNVFYTATVSAEDFADNSADTTWTFRTIAPPPLPEFVYNLTVLSIAGTDTAITNLRIGTDVHGTDLYDPGLDVPQFLFPGAPRGYFPLMDPTRPEITALSTDIRAASGAFTQWIVDCYAPRPNQVLKWNPATLPFSSDVATFQYAVADSGTFPTDYYSMALYSSANFGPNQVVYIRLLPTPGETDPPIIRNISHYGAGAPADRPLVFEVIDYGSGVNMSTFSMSINASLVSTYTATPIAGGYRITYTPPGGLWAVLMPYDVEVDVDDNFGNHCHRAWNFITNTGGTCGPEFSLPLTFTYGTAPGDVEAIILGMDNDASPSFDVGLDAVLPPPIGAGFYFFGTGSAPYNRLTADYRNNCDLGSIWKVGIVNSRPTVTVTWSASNPIFLEDRYKLYYKVLSIFEPDPVRPTEDTTWLEVELATNIVYNPAIQRLYFSYDIVGGGPGATYCITGRADLFGRDDDSGVRVQIVAGPYRITGSNGRYEFCGLAPNCYVLTFSKDSFTTVVDTVCITDSDVVLDVTLYLTGSRKVSGTMRVEGVPTFGVSVRIISATFDTLNTVSNFAGYYEFPSVPPGTYSMRAGYTGYVPWDTTFTVTTSDVVINHNFTPTTVPVSGIAHLAGTPSAGVAIWLDGVSTGVTSGDGGAYSINALPGLRTICGRYIGYAEDCTTITVPPSPSGVSGANLYLLRTSVTLTVQVDLLGRTDESGASVQLVGVGTETTPASGIVRFSGLAHGTYNINVSCQFFKNTSLTGINVTRDTLVNVQLCYLAPVTGLTATGATLPRPTTTSPSVALSWTAASSACSAPVSYMVYRAGFPFTSTTTPGVLNIASVTGTAYTDTTVVAGTTYYYDIVVTYADPSTYSPLAGNVNAVSNVLPDTFDILIVDWDNGATPVNGGTMGVGEWWQSKLTATALGTALSVRKTTATTGDPLAGYDLNDYGLVVVALGITDADDTPLPMSAQTKLDSYRATPGKKLILEGPDFGEDYTGNPFFRNFNLNLVSGGLSQGNVFVYRGTSALWGNIEIHYTYADSTPADRFNDIWVATSGTTVPVGWDQSGNARTFFYNSSSQAILSSVYLGGIVEGAYPYTQLRAVSGYLWKLGIANTFVDEMEKPSEFALLACYPNPFNPVTTIAFDVPVSSPVEVAIYDITGKRVATIVNSVMEAGKHSTTWDASALPSGVYFARMISGNFTATQKLVLMK